MTRLAQKQLVLNALKSGPKTSWQLQQLGICCHTKRISELREEGKQILTSKEKRSGRWVFIYTLLDPTQTTATQYERVNGHDERVGECSNCRSLVYRKPKARAPLPGERLFCQQSCHDAYWNGKKRQAELFTGVQQISTAFADARE